MRAVIWEGKNNVKVGNVPDPEILNPRDAIVKITLTAICGSDLHLYNGCIPTMKQGDVLGHEFMGEVVEIGSEVKNLTVGDWVVVPFAIACGRCFFCERDLWSLCDNSNPNAWIADTAYGHSGAALFGYSHIGIEALGRLSAGVEVMSPDLLTRWWRLVQCHPIRHELRDYFRKSGKVRRLSYVAVCSKTVPIDEVLFIDGRRENSYRNQFRAVVGAHSPQNFKSIHLWKIQIN